MQMHFIPTNKGMDREELGSRIQHGWIYFGRQAVRGPAIANVTEPNAPIGVADVDIWVLPEPTIPLSALVHILVEIHLKQADASLWLDDVARAIFGQGIVPLAEAFASAAEQGGSEDVE